MFKLKQFIIDNNTPHETYKFLIADYINMNVNEYKMCLANDIFIVRDIKYIEELTKNIIMI